MYISHPWDHESVALLVIGIPKDKITCVYIAISYTKEDPRATIYKRRECGFTCSHVHDAAHTSCIYIPTSCADIYVRIACDGVSVYLYPPYRFSWKNDYGCFIVFFFLSLSLLLLIAMPPAHTRIPTIILPLLRLFRRIASFCQCFYITHTILALLYCNNALQ